VVLGLQHGDEAKGKVTHYLCKFKDYTHVLRFNGGCNAGHTIYHEGKKHVTHHIPAGVFYGIKSIIGPGCVVNPPQFFKEIEELESNGIDTKGKIFISTNAHVITEDHMYEEEAESKIGTTKRGNGPAYRDKYARTGLQAKDVKSLEPYLIDLYEEFHSKHVRTPVILCEGAQGFGLDIDWGEYPYVTSSHCGLGGVLLNGIPHTWIRDVWAVAKIYETYVGSKSFEPQTEDDFFEQVREVGEEYGATTGRPRQCSWLDLDTLKRTLTMNSVNKVVFNKMDVLRALNRWQLVNDGELITLDDEQQVESFISHMLPDTEIYFSDDKHKI